MNSGLRKVHKFSWILIAILGTVFLFFAIKELNFNTQKPEEKAKVEIASLPQSKEDKWIKVSLKGNQVELVVKTPLKTSSSVIYGLHTDGKKQVLGQVTTVGIYVFYTDKPIQGIEVFDKIKEVELTKIVF